MRTLEQMRRDINLIGCMTDADILNGSTAERAIPPTPPTPLFNIIPKTPYQAVWDYREECMREYGAIRDPNTGEIIGSRADERRAFLIEQDRRENFTPKTPR